MSAALQERGRPHLTILTDPVPGWSTAEHGRRVARAIVRRVARRPAHLRSAYRGHFAVTRSLVEGCRKIGVRVTYNPTTMRGVGRVVGVLSSAQALSQAIAWKRAGRIDRLLAGPNLVNFPSDHDGLIADPAVDVCVTPSALVRAMYEDDLPALTGRCVEWPAGVDTAFWSPDGVRGDDVLIFEKPTRWPLESSAAYAAILRARGYRVSTLRYGRYTSHQFREQLRRARLMVGFASTESQGIAWAEAWSCDVATLLWRQDAITFTHPVHGLKTYATSTAPYLSDATGRFFQDVPSFEAALADWEAGRFANAARSWVLHEMSDEVCARRYLGLAGIR